MDRSSYFYEYSRGWAKEHCCILAVESQVLSGRKHCWSNDRERERQSQRERDGGEIEICVCVGFERNCFWLSWIFIPF